MSTFSHPYTIGLHDSDAAAMVFSANLIRICHLTFEAFMESIGFPLGMLLKERPFGMPVVHIEGDFQKILRVGDKVEVRLNVAELTRASVRFAYQVVKDGDVYATAAMVHVCVAPKEYRSRELPAEFRARLMEFQRP